MTYHDVIGQVSAFSGWKQLPDAALEPLGGRAAAKRVPHTTGITESAVDRATLRSEARRFRSDRVVLRPPAKPPPETECVSRFDECEQPASRL